MTGTKICCIEKPYTIYLLIFIFCLMIAGCATTPKSGIPMDTPTEKADFQINDKTVRAMVDKAEPLIEEVTEMKFKNRMKCEVVKRDVIRDELTRDLIPQLKKLLNTANDDMITRQAEMVAQSASQSMLGKYSPTKKVFYIVPDNVKTVTKLLEVKDDQIENFVFLLVTHEMVHALDDQYFDLKEKITSRTNVESAGAFNSLMEGHAVYVTDKVADKLKMSETAKQLSVKSAAGLTGTANRMQQQTYHNIYEKGAEFVKAIIGKKGPAIITTAFNSPPVSSAQIFYPDKYLNPTDVTDIDCSTIIKKVAEQLPVDGMGKQSLDIGGMVLRTMLVSKGIPENEVAPIADNCIGGAVFIAAKQAVQTRKGISMLIVNFNSGETVSRFDEISQKIEKSDVAQINARLNASYKIIKEEDLKLEGFNAARCKQSETKIDDKVTTKLGSTAIIGNMYIEVGFENMEDLTEKDMVDILNRIYTEQSKMRQGVKPASL